MTISKAIAAHTMGTRLQSMANSPQNLLSINKKTELFQTVKSLSNELSNSNKAIANYLSNGMSANKNSGTLKAALVNTSNVIQQFLEKQSTSKNDPSKFLAQSGPVNDSVKKALKSLLFHMLVDLASKQLMKRLDNLVKNMAVAMLLHNAMQSESAQMSKPPAKNMGIEGLDESVDFKSMLKDFKNFGINGKTADGKRVKIRVNEKDVKKHGGMEAALEHKMKKAGISDLSELKNVKLIGKRTDGMQTHWMKPKDLNEISAGKKDWGDVRKKGFFEKIGGFFKGIGKGIANIGKGIWNGIKGIGKGIVNVAKSVGNAVVGVAKGIGKGIVGIAKTGGAFLGKVFKGDFKGAGNVLKKGAEDVWNNVKGAAIKVKDGVVSIGKGAWNIAKGIGNGVVSMYKGGAEAMGKLFRGDIGGAFNSMADGYKNQWAHMSDGFKTGLGQMVNGASSITSAPVSVVAGKEAGDAVSDVTKKVGNFGTGFVTGGIDGMAKVTAGGADIANGRGSVEENVAKMTEGAFDVAMSATGAGGALKGVKGLSNLGSMAKAGKVSHTAGNGFVSGAKTQMNVLDDIALSKKKVAGNPISKLKEKLPGADKSHTTQSLVLNKTSKLFANIASTPTEQTNTSPGQKVTSAVQWT